MIAAAVLGMSLLNLGDYTVYFYTPDEALAKASTLQDQDIKVGGMVMPGSVQWEAQSLSLKFDVSDLKGAVVHVQHKGTPPDMFKEHQGVIAEGRISPDGKTFVARTLMVKHSEEYKAPDDRHSVDKKLLEQSIFK